LFGQQAKAQRPQNHALGVDEVAGFDSTAKDDLFEDQRVLLELSNERFTGGNRYCGRLRKSGHSRGILRARLDGVLDACRRRASAVGTTTNPAGYSSRYRA